MASPSTPVPPWPAIIVVGIIGSSVMAVIAIVLIALYLWRPMNYYDVLEVMLIGHEVLAFLGAGCLLCIFFALRTVIGMERINRYRAERDEELVLLLADVRTALQGHGGHVAPGDTAGGSSHTALPSSVFRSSMMAFPPPGEDAALTSLRPARGKDDPADSAKPTPGG